MYNEEERLYRLIPHLVSRARDSQYRHVTDVVPGVLAAATLARFRELHDRAAEFD